MWLERKVGIKWHCRPCLEPYLCLKSSEKAMEGLSQRQVHHIKWLYEKLTLSLVWKSDGKKFKVKSYEVATSILFVLHDGNFTTQ